jgi:DNA-binding CsgD family transcriptional regulator
VLAAVTAAALSLVAGVLAWVGAALDDIAHRLFLGPRTARLLQASAMAKLGVESTAELAAAAAAW